MNWQKNRLWLVAAALVLLVGAVVWAGANRRRRAEPVALEAAAKLPKLDAAKVDGLQIDRPKTPALRLVKAADGWRLQAPVEAEADQEAVQGALSKLAELEVGALAATQASSHAKLEVSAELGVHVVATQSGKVVRDLWLGSYRGGNTMLRLPGGNQVYEGKGSMRYAFDKDIKDWRNRQILKLEAGNVRELHLHHPEGQFAFVRRDGAWVASSAKPPIKDFDATEVDSLVSSLADLRAADFAAPNVDAAAAGLSGSQSTVSLLVAGDSAAAGKSKPDAGVQPSTPTQVLLTLGGKNPAGETYLQRQGDATVYLIAAYLADRLRPKAADLQKKPDAKPQPGAADAAPDEMPPGGGEIPPEVMQRLRQQMGAP